MSADAEFRDLARGVEHHPRGQHHRIESTFHEQRIVSAAKGSASAGEHHAMVFRLQCCDIVHREDMSLFAGEGGVGDNGTACTWSNLAPGDSST